MQIGGKVYLLSALCTRVASLEIFFWDLPVKMTSTNEFVPVMKQNVLVIVPDCQKHRMQNMQWLKSLTAWLVSVYNVYA
jgi:hypothetical protein